MIKSRNQNNFKPSSKTSAVTLFGSSLRFAGYDNGQSVYEIDYQIDVLRASYGSQTQVTLLLYRQSDVKQDIARKDLFRNGVQLPNPLDILVLDFSTDISNDDLSLDNILSSQIRTRTQSVEYSLASEAGVDSSAGTVLGDKQSLTRFSAYNNFNSPSVTSEITASLENRFLRFLKTGKLAFSTIDQVQEMALGRAQTDGLVRENSRFDETEKLTILRNPSESVGNSYIAKKVRSSSRYLAGTKKFSIPSDEDITCLFVNGNRKNSFSSLSKIKPIFVSNFGRESNRTQDVNLHPPTIRFISRNTEVRKIVIECENTNAVPVNYQASLLYRSSLKDSSLTSTSLITTELAPKQTKSLQITIPKSYNSFLVSNFRYGSNTSTSSIAKVGCICQIGSAPNSNISRSKKLVVTAYTNSKRKAIEVSADLSNVGSARSYVFRRRVRSLDGSIVSDFESVSNQNIEYTDNGLRYTDDLVKHDKVYEYRLYSLDELSYSGDSSFVLYRNPEIYPNEVGNLQVSLVSNSNGNSTFDAKVNFSTTNIEQVLTSLQNSIDGNIQTDNGNVQIGNYIENLKNNREKLTDLFRINVVRQDLETGNEYEVGSFPAGTIELNSSVLSTRNIPSQSSRSRYLFRLYQRNAITLFNEIEEQITDPETLKSFQVKISKFLNPLNTVSNILPSSLRVLKNNPIKSSKIFANDEFISGYTGVVRSIEVDRSKQVSNISDAVLRVTTQKNDRIVVSCEIPKAVNIESIGYILYCGISSKLIPVGYFAPDSLDSSRYVDTVTNIYKGPRKYYLFSISNNLEINQVGVSDTTLVN